MGISQVDPQTRGLIPLRFCEYNYIVPLWLKGRKLTVAAAHPDSYDLRPALASLRAKYDVEIMQVSEAEVKAIIDANYYGKCEGCGAKIDYGCRWCTTCKLKMPAPPVPVAPPVANDVAPAQSQVPAYDVAGPDLAGKTCPYCQAPIKPNVHVHVCDACGIPHHAECWRDNGGCTTFGCSNASSGSPAPVQPQPVQPQPVHPMPQVYGHPGQVLRYIGAGLLITVIAVIAIVAVWWQATAKFREFRADARVQLKQLQKIESRLDVGVNYIVFSALVADLHQSMDEFRDKYESRFGNNPAYEDLDEAEKAYVESVDVWRDKIDASEDDLHDYDSDLQDCWHKASDALDRARDELK